MNKKEQVIFIAKVLMCVLVVVLIAAVLAVSYKNMLSQPVVTDKRYHAGYTEIVQRLDGSDRLYKVCPEKYELQLDGENWVEVTADEYNNIIVGEHIRR